MSIHVQVNVSLTVFVSVCVCTLWLPGGEKLPSFLHSKVREIMAFLSSFKNDLSFHSSFSLSTVGGGGWKWGGRGLNVIDKEQASVHLWKASAVVDEEQKDGKEPRAKCCSPALMWSIKKGRKIVYSMMGCIAEEEPSPSAHPVLHKNPLSLSVTHMPCFCPILYNDATIPERLASLRWCTHNKYLMCVSAEVSGQHSGPTSARGFMVPLFACIISKLVQQR